MPMKILMLARVISSFLTNSPNVFTTAHDDICEVIARNGVLDKMDKKSLHVLAGEYFRITKKLCGVFAPFSTENLRVQSYRDVEAVYKRINVPVFLLQE